MCPVCKSKTRLKIRKDTILDNFPLFCPKCKSEMLICVKQFHISIIKEPDAEPIIRSPWVRVIGSFVFWGGYQSKLPPYTMTLGGTRRFPWRDRRVHFAFSHYP
ncbi:TPA: cysteine-rich KTR domain-containing protein [Clostridioides difficile]|nr:cysteine-rich KTR domain-containing protein [Clostridioides difficile]HBF8035313.1 cysteine-rich KTR domain-containing protein [Clostridioides difficile]HBH3131676.1 cysteine-rich KTR domain-containing protein [Clostridioides difficile]